MLDEKTEQEIQKLPQWKQEVTRKLMESRLTHRKERYEKLKGEVAEKLTDLINLYFGSFSLDHDENKNNYDILNKEWKSICHKVSAAKSSIITMDVEAFEKSVDRHMSTEAFKAALEKLKSEEDAPVLEDTEIKSESGESNI